MNLIPLFSKLWELVGKSDEKRIAAQIPTPGVAVVADVAYVDDGTREHLLDVYYPENTKKKLPVIIDIHGGGWMYGYKEINKNYNLRLASSGYTVFSINYRLVPQVYMNQQLQDVFLAFDFIEKVMDDYPCDRSNVYLTGDSAGGQLACFAAAIQNSPRLCTLFGVEPGKLVFNAVCLTSPVCDMTAHGLMGIYHRCMLEPGYHKKGYGRFLNIESLLEVTKLPPVFLVSSSGDYVAKRQTGRAAKAIEASGTPYKYMYWKRSRGRKLKHVFAVIDPEMPESAKAIDSMLLFFDKYSSGAAGEKAE